MRNRLKLLFILHCLGTVTAGIAALSMVGCTATVEKQASASELVEPGVVPVETEVEVEAKPKITRVEPVRPKIALTEEILYKLLIAEVAGQKGRLDISIEHYLALAHSTRDPEVVARAARIAVYARDDRAALDAARLWVELDPRNPDPHQVLAVMQLRAGNLEQAVEHLQDIFDYSDGEIDQKLWMIANMLGREKDRESVLAVMEALVSSRNNSAEALYAFAHVAARLGDLERALALLEKTLALVPDNDNAALSYISILQRSGREKEAITWLERNIAAREDNDFNLRMAYARILTDARRFEEARGQFELLFAEAPDNTDVLYTLGLLYLQGNRWDDAEIYFNRLLEQGKLTDTVNYYLGRIAEEKQDHDKASAWYQGVHKGENYFDAQVRLALLLAKKGEIEQARSHLNAIQTQGEQQAIILVQAEGELLIEEKRYAEALAVYDKALEGKYNADLLYARAMIAEKIGRLDILETDLRTILEREPDHAQALNALGYTLADATDRYDEAYELIKKALELNPSDFYILDSMGWVLYRLGRLDEAIDYLRKAMSLRADPEIAAHLGEVLWVNGNRDEAKEIWESALKLTPEDAHLLDVIQRFNP